MDALTISAPRPPWNKDKLVGQKRPFKLKEIWAIRTRLQLSRRTRDLALFNLGIDSKLRACDLVKLRVRDVANGDRTAARANVVQQKTGRPVQFELTDPTREAVSGWINLAHLRSEDFLFPSRVHSSPHLGTRQYARIVDGWVEEIAGPGRVRHPLNAPDQGVLGLPPNEEPSRGATPARPHQAREYCALPRHRGRGRTGDG